MTSGPDKFGPEGLVVDDVEPVIAVGGVHYELDQIVEHLRRPGSARAVGQVVEVPLLVLVPDLVPVLASETSGGLLLRVRRDLFEHFVFRRKTKATCQRGHEEFDLAKREKVKRSGLSWFADATSPHVFVVWS